MRKLTDNELNGCAAIPGRRLIFYVGTSLATGAIFTQPHGPVTLRLEQSEREAGVTSPTDEKYSSSYYSFCLRGLVFGYRADSALFPCRKRLSFCARQISYKMHFRLVIRQAELSCDAMKCSRVVYKDTGKKKKREKK